MMFLMPYSNFLLVSNDDAIKWSKKDAKVAICTEKLVYVLSPPSISEVKGGGTDIPFSLSLVDLPENIKHTIDSTPRSKKQMIHEDTDSKGNARSTFSRSVEPCYNNVVDSGKFVTCEWSPLLGRTGFYLSALTSHGFLLIFKCPSDLRRKWDLVCNVSEVYLDMYCQREEATEALQSIVQLASKRYCTSFKHFETLRLQATFTAHSWQEIGGCTEARLAVGARFGSVSVVSVSSVPLSKEDQLSISVLWSGKIDKALSHEILSIAWKQERALTASDVSFAVGCSDGSVYLFSQSGAVEDQQSLDFVHTKVITADFIPVSQLKWCPRYSHFQGSSQDCDTSEDTKRRPNGNPDEESGLLCSKRSAVAVVIFRRGVTSQVKYVSGLHTLPISGIAVHQTVKGMVAMTTAKDGTMQSFYPYAEDNDSSDGQNIIKSVKRTEIASSSFQGIASSPNGCYVTVLGSTEPQEAKYWPTNHKKLPRIKVDFVTLMESSDVEKAVDCWSYSPGSPGTCLWDLLLLVSSHKDIMHQYYLACNVSRLEQSSLNLQKLRILLQLAHLLNIKNETNELERLILVYHVKSCIQFWLTHCQGAHKVQKHHIKDNSVIINLARWLKRTSEESETLADQVLSQFNGSDVPELERCVICKAAISVTKSDEEDTTELDTVCTNGHMLSRCSLSLAIPENPVHVKECSHCGVYLDEAKLVADSWMSKYLQPLCLFCGRPFT